MRKQVTDVELTALIRSGIERARGELRPEQYVGMTIASVVSWLEEERNLQLSSAQVALATRLLTAGFQTIPAAVAAGVVPPPGMPTSMKIGIGVLVLGAAYFLFRKKA